jgi:hypothetical protein
VQLRDGLAPDETECAGDQHSAHVSPHRDTTASTGRSVKTLTLALESDITIVRKSRFSPTKSLARTRFNTGSASATNSRTGGPTVLEELIRMTITWGVMCALVAFFYWMMSNIGTF